MTGKIFRSITAVAVTMLVAALVIASTFLYDYFSRQQVNQLQTELRLIAARAEEVGTAYFDYLDSSAFRFTLVGTDGTVLYDTVADEAAMDNHSDREEIREALAEGQGSAARYSETLTRQTVYEAVRLENGDVLRISVERTTVGALILSMLPAISATILGAVVVALLLSDRMAKSIVKPLSELDLEHPADNVVYEELQPVLTKLNLQRRQIARQMRELKQRADEFEQITSSMNEGLVLLDRDGVVLSLNTAARRLFGVDGTAVGRHFLTVDRSEAMSRAINRAAAGQPAEFTETRGESEYRFIVSRTEAEGDTVGILLLCFDVTAIAAAERSRREFTANVSHELKTPLQSIIGSAELLENGMVRPEDTARFIGNIKHEAGRLVSLINDIIRLSQLDEGGETVPEEVDLYEIAAEVTDVLSSAADKRRVTLQLTGEACPMRGVRRYLYEVLYNLCDNAVRYNVEGGTVTVSLTCAEEQVTVTVRDTGIGIPAEHQPRIFERFYRVDKSHSRETGGTGLGLSIVKHAVAYHGGTLQLDSAPGRGTTVTVTFPV